MARLVTLATLVQVERLGQHRRKRTSKGAGVVGGVCALIGGGMGVGLSWACLVHTRKRGCGMAWFDDLLGAVNLIDWAEGIIRGIRAGDVVGHRIALPHPEHSCWEENQIQPWSLNEMIAVLESYHVQTYGRGFNSEEIWIHVPQRQARWAEYVLARAGAPVQMATVDERNQQWAANPAHNGQMPPRWDDRERHTAPTWAEEEG